VGNECENYLIRDQHTRYVRGSNNSIARKQCLAPLAHTYNPSYSGGRDQEDRGSNPAQANSSQDPISKQNHHKKGLVEWLKV
jgi:hypothetical protein